MKQATLYKKLPNNAVQCTACSHYCKIVPDKTGICGVRQNINGELQLLVYGKAFSNIDPIEKKPLFHFLPNTEIFSIGTVGCNFGCLFCQNYFESQVPKELQKDLGAKGQMSDYARGIAGLGADLSPENIVSYCVKNKIPSIAYTYNEPSIFFEYTYDTAKLAHEAGIKNVYVSNGYASKEAIDKIQPYLDAINVDLKGFTEDFYKKICFARLKPVLENIKYYYKKGILLEITTLIIPDENDSEDELRQIAEYIASISTSIPWHISRFSPAFMMIDKSETPMKTLQMAYDVGKKAGLKYVYAGNIFGKDLHSTYCPECNSILIERDWGYTKVLGLKDGKCNKCGTEIEGVWK